MVEGRDPIVFVPVQAMGSETERPADAIAARSDATKPTLSKHLRILESAGPMVRERWGRFVFHRIRRDNIARALTGLLQAVCPVSQGLK